MLPTMTTELEPLRLAHLYARIRSGEAVSIRRSAGLSQSDVARAIGADKSTVASWESCNRSPRGALAARYDAFLESLAGLLSESSTKALP
jgi:DNA-binding transcriptional regulator YiaG